MDVSFVSPPISCCEDAIFCFQSRGHLSHAKLDPSTVKLGHPLGEEKETDAMLPFGEVIVVDNMDEAYQLPEEFASDHVQIFTERPRDHQPIQQRTRLRYVSLIIATYPRSLARTRPDATSVTRSRRRTQKHCEWPSSITQRFAKLQRHQ